MTVRLRKRMRIPPGEVTNLCTQERQRGTAFGGRKERVKTGEVKNLCAREDRERSHSEGEWKGIERNRNVR